MEIELKLLIEESHLPKLANSPLIKGVATGEPLKKQLINVYFDTPERDLRRAEMGLRVRHMDGHHLQTLKAGGKVNSGLHQNEEWEMEISGNRPDLHPLREMMGDRSPYADLIAAPDLQERLEPIFTTHVNRTIRNLRLSTGEEIEMAMDQGTIECGEDSQVISEVELELKSGDPVRLYSFALALLEEFPMRIGTYSKAQRGYAMANPAPHPIIKARKLKLQPSMTVERAFEAIVANCMEQVQGNAHGVVHGTDPASVHQMRVGLRRLRSALDLFEGVIECPTSLQQEWKWLANQLGAARDWEVLALSTLEALKDQVSGDIDIGALKRAAMEKAKKNRDTAAKAVDSPRHTRLQLQFAEWMMNKGWRSTVSPEGTLDFDMPLKKFAKQVLKQREQRLIKRSKHLAHNDPVARHRFRIAGKKARYATEFFESLYPKARVKDYVDALSDMQQELGWLNDAAVAIDLLGQLQPSAKKTVTSAAFVRGYLHALVHGENAHLMDLWDTFSKTNPPYKA